MKWNDEWSRGVSENWSNPPYFAWQTSMWNGNLDGGSGQSWHIKAVWDKTCGSGNPPLPGSEFCVGWVKTILVSGKVSGLDPVHFWILHVNPTGYGAYFKP